jgi:hypothetical protein
MGAKSTVPWLPHIPPRQNQELIVQIASITHKVFGLQTHTHTALFTYTTLPIRIPLSFPSLNLCPFFFQGTHHPLLQFLQLDWSN